MAFSIHPPFSSPYPSSRRTDDLCGGALGGGAEPGAEFAAGDGDGDVVAALGAEFGEALGRARRRRSAGVGYLGVERDVGVELRYGQLPQVFVQVTRSELAFGHEVGNTASVRCVAVDDCKEIVSFVVVLASNPIEPFVNHSIVFLKQGSGRRPRCSVKNPNWPILARICSSISSCADKLAIVIQFASRSSLLDR